MTSTRELFGRHSLRCTQQRMAVYESLHECECHPTAEELFRLVKPRIDRVSLATVYNALETLCRAGLVKRMATMDGCCRYDADTSPHLHVRFRDTGKIEDVPRELGAKLMARVPREVLEEIGEAIGAEVDGLNIQLLASPREGSNEP